ncbi:CU044_5270 family protein [Streptomyces sp. Je 1-369]|uniref:CU044_5270 family protein n=1 Tax=Streptomyces sp. Je 1-369 TaxID=2966192 RepID=UPI00228643B1|nr:CU044_5270 family protein [Streptomyces sp. Je 1-369]WAL97629.1 CU044_5270 family protein [Streptomyces sp. Je 1-369]
MTERTDHSLLDFPGAGELIAAGGVAPPSAGAVDGAWEAVARTAREEERARPTTAPPTRLTSHRVRRPRRLLVAAAAVAAIATGAVAYPVLDMGGEPAATASASQFFEGMAEVAEDAPATTPAYWKVRVETDNQDDGKRTDTSYFDREGRVWSVDADGTVHEPPAGEEGKVKKWPVGKKWLTWPELEKLPTDEKTLAALFPKDAHSRFDQVTIMLEDSPASPELRAALFRILADTPGMKLVGDVRDSKGRAGVAVEITQNSWVRLGEGENGGDAVTLRSKDRYIIAPDTGLLLETTHKTIGRDTPPDRYTWLEVGPADRVE